MWFKKNSIKSKENQETKLKKIRQVKLIPALFTAFSLIVVGGIGIFIFSIFWNFNINIPNPFSIIGQSIGGEVWESKTNILVIGRGWWTHDAPNLTDSMILLSIEKNSNVISMLSIPRDLYVDLPEGGKWKINEIYSKYLEGYKLTDNEAAKKLENKTEEMTGEKINYYVNIDFAGFKKIVDLVGGVQVTLDENLVDYEYPTDNEQGYTTFILRKWTWLLDGETALKFSRSRHSTSDFDRSLRQQQIVSGLKSKLAEQGYLSNPIKMKELYSIMSEYVKTDLDLGAIIQLAKQSRQENQIISFNLNNSCYYGSASCEKWGFLYTPDRDLFWGASVLVPNGATYKNLGSYTEIQKFANIIFNFRNIFEENIKINIFNGTKQGNIAKTFADSLIPFGFNIPSKWSVGNTDGKIFEKTTIYYHSTGSDIPKTVKALQLFIQGELQKTESPVYSKEPDTGIEIVLWNDYLEKDSKPNLTTP